MKRKRRPGKKTRHRIRHLQNSWARQKVQDGMKDEIDAILRKAGVDPDA